VDGGRCETCKGEGSINAKMVLWPMFNCETVMKRLEGGAQLHFAGKNIHDILTMIIDDAVAFWRLTSNIKSTQKLKPLQDVGLGYVQLGQSSSTLSGGEAQRIKLASFLVRKTFVYLTNY
jgi:excinuclease ABC subunit A